MWLSAPLTFSAEREGSPGCISTYAPKRVAFHAVRLKVGLSGGSPAASPKVTVAPDELDSLFPGSRFLYPSIHLMAAAYLFALVNNHPFVDGNNLILIPVQDDQENDKAFEKGLKNTNTRLGKDLKTLADK
jgi:hypothetical protein